MVSCHYPPYSPRKKPAACQIASDRLSIKFGPLLQQRLLHAFAGIFRHATIFVFVAASTMARLVAPRHFSGKRANGFSGKEFLQAIQHGDSLHKKRDRQLCRLSPLRYGEVRKI
jgi:hypothetical protein